MRALFDSSILIDALLEHEAAIAVIKANDDRAISVVTWIEVMTGAAPPAEAVTRRFLERFERIGLSDPIALEAVRVRQRARLRLPDAVIVASARVTNRTLITRDVKDMAGLEQVVVPYHL